MVSIVYDNFYGDWMAIYKDGVLLDQRHSFDARRVLELLEIKFEVVNAMLDEDSVGFPYTLGEVVRL